MSYFFQFFVLKTLWKPYFERIIKLIFLRFVLHVFMVTLSFLCCYFLLNPLMWQKPPCSSFNFWASKFSPTRDWVPSNLQRNFLPPATEPQLIYRGISPHQQLISNLSVKEFSPTSNKAPTIYKGIFPPSATEPQLIYSIGEFPHIND